MKNNIEIRLFLEKTKIKYWKVAEQYGLNDGNFSRLLRHELSDEKKEKILKIIAELEKKGL